MTASARTASAATRVTAGTWATAAVVCLAWAVALPRLVPGTTGDHGTYVSVAERLLAGDRLYVDVWDNKDPLFYYLLAVGRLATPLADIVIEVLWVVVAAVAVLSIARMAGVARLLAVATAFGGVPLLVTGAAYEPGMTHLPAVALILAAVAFGVRGRWVVAGVAVALVLFVKLILLPVAVGGVLVIAVHRRDRRGTLLAGVGAAATTLAGLAVMWGRGELVGWVETFGVNVQYAEGDLSASRYGNVVGHLLRAFPEDSRGAGLATVASITLALLMIRRTTATGSVNRPNKAEAADTTLPPAVLWDTTVVTLLLGLAVIAVTATWPHHLQALYVPGAIALVLIAGRLSRPAEGLRPAEGWRPAVAVALAAYLIGGALHPYYSLTAVRDLRQHVQELRGPSPGSALMESLPQVRTYARAGSNDVGAHAIGLRGDTLVCPRFHQYSIDTAAALEAAAACLPKADALIVDGSVRPEAGAPAWNAYVARVRALVATGYQCLPTTGSEVCVRQR